MMDATKIAALEAAFEQGADASCECRLCGEPYDCNDCGEPSVLCHACAQDAVELMPALIAQLRAQTLVVEAAKALHAEQKRGETTGVDPAGHQAASDALMFAVEELAKREAM